ncbi:uncharacterized protein LOC128870296 [Anastrepha ludens]|uniref:uncharacterized protein LOC128870296 n=1 Tax=Anastrepha ludens TaxID=28586 RepID=UPI0023B16C7D|nr:uncharacterized protein LOC128870296 [Anastrepha ludens]
MEAEMDKLRAVLLQQEGELNLLRQQNQQQQQQQLQQQQQQQQQPQYQEQQHQQQQQPIQWLSNKDIIQQFRQLRQLDDQHDVLAFIKSVEFLMTLCQGNALLIQFGTSIVANEKVSGTAANFIRQLGMEPSWDQMKTKLMEQMRPRMTYEDVFDRCRFIKITLTLLIMCLLPTLSTAMINITPIQAETGFISLGESTVELVSEFKMVLHIISPKEILELTNIIQNNTKILVKKDRQFFQQMYDIKIYWKL